MCYSYWWFNKYNAKSVVLNVSELRKEPEIMKGLAECIGILKKVGNHAFQAKVTQVGGGEINKLVLPMFFSNALECHNDLSPSVKNLG